MGRLAAQIKTVCSEDYVGAMVVIGSSPKIDGPCVGLAARFASPNGSFARPARGLSIHSSAGLG